MGVLANAAGARSLRQAEIPVNTIFRTFLILLLGWSFSARSAPKAPAGPRGCSRGKPPRPWRRAQTGC